MLVTVTVALGTAAPVASWMEPTRLPSSYCALAFAPQNATKRPAKKKILPINRMFLMGARLQTAVDTSVNQG
jgi:hypothetical protein